MKLDDEDDLNVVNEIIDQIVTKKESPQAYGPPILENLASSVTKFWQTEARNKQKIKKLKNKYLVASNYPKFYVPTLNDKKCFLKIKVFIITTNVMTNGGWTSRI